MREGHHDHTRRVLQLRQAHGVRTGDAGSKMTFNFCPACGATVHYALQDREESVVIPVGAFADPDFPSPKFSIYEERRHPWVGLPGDAEHVP